MITLGIWKQIKSLFSFLWFILRDTIDDFRQLFVFANKLRKGERITNPEKVEEFKREMKSLTIGDFLKGSWYWLLAIAFAGVCGWMLGGRWCEIQCNNFIYQNLSDFVRINAQILMQNTSEVPELTYNFSNFSQYR